MGRQTSEGKVKEKVKKFLRDTPGLYYHMPVLSGYGNPTLDFIGCLHGLFFAVETKAAGKAPTERQKRLIADMRSSGAAVFVVTGEDLTDGGWIDLTQWINDVSRAAA